jgi:hypothetical protein
VALFLDVQGTFPNMVKEQLIHNMRMRRVPECFTDIVSLSLTGHTTHLKFDDFVSDPIWLTNSTTQGNPPSMIYYAFYNAPLLDTAKSKDELSPGFVVDSIMLAIGDSLASCHKRLKDMMEREGGGFEWSHTHNSPFELSKTALMDFPRSFCNSSLGDLSLDKPNMDGTVSNFKVKPVALYKYLGVIFDPKLHWSLQHIKATTMAAFWASQVGHLAKASSRVPTARAKQLYNTVAVPRFSYGAEVWYSYLHKPVGAGKTKGSVTVTNKLRSVQHKVAKAITGGLSTTAGDIQDVHAFILLIELLFWELLYRAALHLCALHASHPLHPLLPSAAHCKVKQHLSPIHHLLHFVSINPKNVEAIMPVRRGPGYTPSFKMVIPPSKDDTLLLVTITNKASPVCLHGWFQL